MTIQITIIGLGQIGASIGLALSEKQDLIHRVGYDRQHEIAKQAEKMGAVDKVTIRLTSAVKDADLVLLSLPMDQIREMMDLIAPDLKEGAMVMDTGPVKEVVAAWAGELLPNNRHYIGLTPVLNPAYLHGADSGLEAAHADLFRGGILAIVAPPRSSSEAIKQAADLARLLGATPLFADPAEMDGLMAATHVLPQLVAAALLNATVDQPGWREGQKVAGRAYTEATAPLAFLADPQTLQASTLLNRENILRVLDSTLAALQTLRNDIDAEDSNALGERLERAQKGRERWWRQRQTSEWVESEAFPDTDSPSASDMFGRLLGFGRRPNPKKKSGNQGTR